LLHTGIGNGVVIPHSLIQGISELMVVIGVSEIGIDFDSRDEKPAKLIVLILGLMDSNQMLF